MKRTLLIDAQNLFYRGYHVSTKVNKEGARISGILNTLQMLPNILHKFKPTRVILAWDYGKCEARLKLYPEYKGHRRQGMSEEELENIKWQLKIAQRACKHLPVTQLSIPNIEADDTIGYLAGKLKGEKIIISNDQDFLQLVDKDTSVFMPLKKKRITNKTIKSFLGFDPAYFIYWKSIMGDSSDNIKGVKGIGPKTFAKWYESDTILEEIDEFTEDQAKIFSRNIQLMTICKLMTKKHIEDINEAYESEQVKKPSIRNVQTVLNKNGVKLYNYNRWRYPFSRLFREGRK
jgi:DNA polymerase I